MYSENAKIHCMLTQEEMQQVEEERERKARELKEKLRVRRNEEAGTMPDLLEQGIEGVNRALRTLNEEIAEREVEIRNGDKFWRREQTSKSRSRAERGFKAAKLLQKLCVTIKIGLATLDTLVDWGNAYGDINGFEGSSTLMAVCRKFSMDTQTNLEIAVEEMRDVGLLDVRTTAGDDGDEKTAEPTGDNEDEKAVGRRIKRKRV